MLIDINASYGGRESIQRFDLPTLQTQLDRIPLSLAFVHSNEGAFDQRSANRDLRQVCESDPRLRPVPSIQPRDTFVWRDELEECLALGQRLYHITPTQSPWPVDSVLFDIIVDRLNGSSAAVLVDATMPGLPSRLASQSEGTDLSLIFTETRYYPLTELIPLALRHSNVYIETSRLTSPHGIELCVKELGSSRLLFGSGTSRYPAWVSWQSLIEAPLAVQEREDIAWRNAARLLNIIPPAFHSSLPLDTTVIDAIDIHLHDKIPGTPFPPFTPGTYAGELARNHVVAGVSSSATSIFYDLSQGNTENEALIAAVPQLKGYVVVDPRYLADSVQELERLESGNSFVGVKIHCAHARTPTSAAALRELFNAIAPYRLPVLVHPLGQDWPEALVAIARDHPELPIIAAHGGYGDAPHPTHDAVLRIADQPNIFVEFCSTYLASGAIRRAIEAVGVQRVLFGSDFPLISLPYMRNCYLEAELSAPEAAKIYIENALGLFPDLIPIPASAGQDLPMH